MEKPPAVLANSSEDVPQSEVNGTRSVGEALGEHAREYDAATEARVLRKIDLFLM